MKVPSYVKVTGPFLKDGKMTVNVKFKRWGVFFFLWDYVKSEGLDFPKYLWPLVYFYICFRVLLFGLPGHEEGVTGCEH